MNVCGVLLFLFKQTNQKPLRGHCWFSSRFFTVPVCNVVTIHTRLLRGKQLLQHLECPIHSPMETQHDKITLFKYQPSWDLLTFIPGVRGGGVTIWPSTQTQLLLRYSSHKCFGNVRILRYFSPTNHNKKAVEKAIFNMITTILISSTRLPVQCTYSQKVRTGVKT